MKTEHSAVVISVSKWARSSQIYICYHSQHPFVHPFTSCMPNGDSDLNFIHRASFTNKRSAPPPGCLANPGGGADRSSINLSEMSPCLTEYSRWIRVYQSCLVDKDWNWPNQICAPTSLTKMDLIEKCITGVRLEVRSDSIFGVKFNHDEDLCGWSEKCNKPLKADLTYHGPFIDCKVDLLRLPQGARSLTCKHQN